MIDLRSRSEAHFAGKPAHSVIFMLLTLLSCPSGFGQESRPQRLFQDALAAQQRGDLALALRDYQELVKLHPNMIAARANLAGVLTSLGRSDEAITEYRRALTQAPGDPALRLNLALVYYKKGDLSTAARQLSDLHKTDPSNLRIAILLGDCLSRAGQAAQTIALLTPFEAANADNLDLEWTLGSALVRADRASEGLRLIEKVIHLRPRAEAFLLAAETYLKLQAFDEAKRQLTLAEQLDPRLPGLYALSGAIKAYAGDDKGAAAEFEKALEVDPHDFEAHLRLGAVLYRRRDLDAVRLHLDRALEIKPASSLARYELGRVEAAKGQLEPAVKEFEQVAKAEPDWLPPHIELAALYCRVNRPLDGARQKQIVEQLTAQQAGRQPKPLDLSLR